jgi:hypothetical protein
MAKPAPTGEREFAASSLAFTKLRIDWARTLEDPTLIGLVLTLCARGADAQNGVGLQATRRERLLVSHGGETTQTWKPTQHHRRCDAFVGPAGTPLRGPALLEVSLVHLKIAPPASARGRMCHWRCEPADPAA